VGDTIYQLHGRKTVIVKSTLMPGTTDALQAAYPQHRIFYVPEFLSEDTAQADYRFPRRVSIVGVPEARVDAPVPQLPLPVGPGMIATRLPARQAELLKLATNAFYALKVGFANMLYDAGMDQDTLYALGDDPWIGSDHFAVEHKGYRGFGGKCLPKDTQALLQIAGRTAAGAILADLLDYNEELQRATSDTTEAA